METIVDPIPSMESFPEKSRGVFEGLQSPAGDEMVLQNNMFVKNIQPASILRDLSEEEMNEYRRPFVKAGEDRRPTLTWQRQIPISRKPADVVEIVSAYSQGSTQTPTPKPFINAESGMLIAGPVREYVRSWPNLTEVSVSGLHFMQEDSPDGIGEAIRDWHADL